MMENQGLSYGLFHAIAQPVYSWGVIRKVTFPGVNMDIGHVRPIGYSKDNDKNTWIAYNKLRGQYMSALEHAIPERFFNDPTKCNTEGTTTPVLGLPVCPQGISAVKAIGIAASQGQKIYTITAEVYQNNPNIVNANLSAHSQITKQKIQNELDAGREVTIHEKPIMQSGWTGSGYIYTDPETGAGGYIIEGGSNGAWIPVAAITFTMLAMVLGPLLGALFLVGTTASAFIGTVILIGGVIYGLTQYIKYINDVIDRPDMSIAQKQQLIAAVSVLATLASLFSYFKAGGDATAAAMGIMMGGLSSGFKKLEEILWGLF